MGVITNKLGVKIPYDKVRRFASRNPYSMDLSPEKAFCVQKVAGQSLFSKFLRVLRLRKDKPLQDCKIIRQGNRYRFEISNQELPVLIQKLYETEDKKSHDLASSMLWNIGIGEIF